MSKKVRFAIIGGGMIADFHARAMAEISDIELVGVYEPVAKQAEKFSEKFSIQAFESYDKLLESENIDAVSICTPSGLHASQAILAMQHGKHVVMEKPMAITSEDARMIVDLSRQTGLKVCVISQFRFSPAIQRVKQEIEKGSFGKVVTASLAMNYYRTEEYYNSSDWKGTWAMDGGGALMNQGIHGVDILQYLMGRVSWVMASMDTMTRPIETEDMVVAIMKFQNGALGTLQASTTCWPGYQRRTEICGDKGSIVLEEDRILKWDLPTAYEESNQAEKALHATSDPKNISMENHKVQLEDMARAILLDKTPIVDAVEGKKSVDIILSIYKSARTGQKVDV